MDLLQYQLQLGQLPNAPATQQLLMECDLLGTALYLQEQRASPGGGLSLDQVAGLVSANGTRYLIGAREDPPAGIDLVRVPPGGPRRRFERVYIEPQRIVKGAPVVFFTHVERDNGLAVACCTSPVRRILRRRG